MFYGKNAIQFADICSFVGKFLINILPFCVRTGAPEVRDPAIDKVLATVDIFLFENKRENSKTSEKKRRFFALSVSTKQMYTVNE